MNWKSESVSWSKMQCLLSLVAIKSEQISFTEQTTWIFKVYDCRRCLFPTLYLWRSEFLQSWICDFKRYFSISDAVLVGAFPLVWKLKRRTHTLIRHACWSRESLCVHILFLIGSNFSPNDSNKKKLCSKTKLNEFGSGSALQVLWPITKGPKGIRGTTLIWFEKWVREQCPNQMPKAKTKHIKTNHKLAATSPAATGNETHLPYYAAKKATLTS